MTLAQICGLVNIGLSNKATPELILAIVDACQKQAFDYDALEFKTWQDLPTYQLLEFAEGDFTLGNAVVGTTITASGATGSIIAFIEADWNTNPSIVVSTDDTYSGAVVFGTGSGTLLSQATWKGPYDAPTDPPVRKIHGIISVTDADIYGTYPTTSAQVDDYGIPLNGYFPDRVFIPGRVNNLEKQFLFSSPPTATTGVVATEPHYRWLYWRNAPDINDTGDNSSLILPAAYHLNLVKACIVEANSFLMGEVSNPEVIQAFFKPWWETLRRQYTPMGVATNLKSMPRQNGDIMI